MSRDGRAESARPSLDIKIAKSFFFTMLRAKIHVTRFFSETDVIAEIDSYGRSAKCAKTS